VPRKVRQVNIEGGREGGRAEGGRRREREGGREEAERRQRGGREEAEIEAYN
jgi:hypothetical protein